MPTRNLCDVQHSSVRCVMGEAREFFERPPFGLRRRARLERHNPGAISAGLRQANPKIGKALFGLGLGQWLPANSSPPT